MKETSDLKTIKKYFGEEMIHFCRSRFCTILDKYPGKLQEVMLSNFASNKFLYEDIVANKLEANFVNYICSFLKEVDILESNLSPIELMKKVGYTLYECENEEDNNTLEEKEDVAEEEVEEQTEINMARGLTEVIQDGVEGKKEITYFK